MTMNPTLTQTQIIQSLAEALSWMEKEISWGVSPADLGHLTGRIGELYAAMITRGQMALNTNQEGYDVVSALNERISVKTVTSSTSVAFNRNTFNRVDRVMVLRLNNDPESGLAVEELLDCTAADAQGRMRDAGTKLVFQLQRKSGPRRPAEDLKVVESAFCDRFEIRKYESGAIRIAADGVLQDLVVKDVLRGLAPGLGVDVLTSAGNVKNTQQLGAEIIRAINART